jgi:hypothetical protein
MGSRVESWPKERLQGMAAFFAQVGYKPTREWKEEHVFWDPLGASAITGSAAPGRAAIAEIGQAAKLSFRRSRYDSAPKIAVFPDGAVVTLPPNRDPREVFADWLITPQSVVHAQHRQPRGRGCSAGASFTRRTISVRTIRPPIPPCSRISNRSWWPAAMI